MATKRPEPGLDGVSTSTVRSTDVLNFAFALVAVTLPAFWVADALAAPARTALVATALLGTTAVAAVAAFDGYRWLRSPALDSDG